MSFGGFVFIGLALGLAAFLTWEYVRHDIQDLTNIPALKKLKKWQLVIGYLIAWALVSILIDLVF